MITQDEDDTLVAAAATAPCSDSDTDNDTDTKMPDEDSDSETEPQTEAELIATTTEPLTPSMITKLHTNPANILVVRPSNTATACENQTTFDTLKLHKLFRCRRFWNQQHVAASSQPPSEHLQQYLTLQKVKRFARDVGTWIKYIWI